MHSGTERALRFAGAGRRTRTALRWCKEEELRSLRLRGEKNTYSETFRALDGIAYHILYCVASFSAAFSIIGTCFVASFRSAF